MLGSYKRDRETIDSDGHGIEGSIGDRIMVFIVVDHVKYTRPWEDGDTFELIEQEYFRAAGIRIADVR